MILIEILANNIDSILATLHNKHCLNTVKTVRYDEYFTNPRIGHEKYAEEISEKAAMLVILQEMCNNPKKRNRAAQELLSICKELVTETDIKVSSDSKADEVSSQMLQIIGVLPDAEKVKIPTYVTMFFNEFGGKHINEFPIDFSLPLVEQLSESAIDVLTYIYSFLK